MQHIIDYAKEKRRIYGEVLGENMTMLQMCTELGFHARGSHMKRVLLEIKNVE